VPVTPAEYRVSRGSWIRRNRLALGLTQEELADVTGVSEASISRWEMGRGEMRAFSHDRLKAYFKTRRPAKRETRA
jgi:transcriptional regulator with XRE-family HTH domain